MTKMSTYPSSRYIPALDGVRGLAILFVVVYHMAAEVNFDGYAMPHLRWFTGFGWAGVDLFFVLSGFLITGILFESKKSAYYLRTFYWRRILRIFPLYYGLIAFALFIAPAIGLTTEQFTGSKEALPSLLTYTYNLHLVFSPEGRRGLFGVVWSLAIEEQFYLIWPFVVLYLNRKILIKLCITLFVLSFLLRVLFFWLHLSNDTSIYFTLSRMDGLVTGAFLALVIRGEGWDLLWQKKYRSLSQTLLGITFFSVLGLFLAVRIIGWDVALVFIISLFAILFGSTLLLAVKLPESHFFVRFFSSKTLRFFGKYSYGIYLLHLPVVHFLDPYCNRIGALLLARHSAQMALFKFLSDFTLVIIAALLSYHLFESFFLRFKSTQLWQKSVPV